MKTPKTAKKRDKDFDEDMAMIEAQLDIERWASRQRFLRPTTDIYAISLECLTCKGRVVIPRYELCQKAHVFDQCPICEAPRLKEVGSGGSDDPWRVVSQVSKTLSEWQERGIYLVLNEGSAEA